MQSALTSTRSGSVGGRTTGGKFGMKKKKGQINGAGGGLGGMVSAMIPGAKVDNKGRIMVNVATSKETLTFNIGGCLFETYRSTLYRLPNSPLANDKFMKEHYREDKNDYFFDRDPDIFRATLNYLRTGELHIPSYICGPAAKMELEFWGVMPKKIERCCWTNYNDWNSTLEALNQLDQDRKGSVMSTQVKQNAEPTFWNTFQPKLWNFLEIPDSSIWAKIYGFISLFFVMLSIFSFVADTTSEFATYMEVYRETITDNVFNTTNVTLGENTTSSINFTTIFAETTPVVSDVDTVRVKHPSLHIIDIICLVFFTVEYILRVIFAPKKLTFLTSVMGVIDVIAILPDYIALILFGARPDYKYDYKVVELVSFFRILRVLRIFRLVKHVPGLWILVYTLKASVGELVLLSCFMTVGILIFASLIYFADERDNFESIPHAFWWALITMTTVGYGDMYPTTTLGKLVGSLCAMSGLLMIGFSVPTLVNNFTLYYKHVQFALQAEREMLLEPEENEGKHCQQTGIGSDMSNKQTDSNDNKTEDVPLMTITSESHNKPAEVC